MTPAVDHGPEFTSRALEDWAYPRGVQLDFIRPGKPVENAYIESFNGRLRDECLNMRQFVSLDDARAKIEACRRDYDQHRPHGALRHRHRASSSPTVRDFGRSKQCADRQRGSVRFRVHRQYLRLRDDLHCGGRPGCACFASRREHTPLAMGAEAPRPRPNFLSRGTLQSLALSHLRV